jgi:hypothetical protein
VSDQEISGRTDPRFPFHSEVVSGPQVDHVVGSLEFAFGRIPGFFETPEGG